MPGFQAILEVANEKFNAKNIHKVAPAHFRPGTPLEDGLDAAQITVGSKQKGVVGNIPDAMKESIRAMIYADLNRKGPDGHPAPFPIQSLWSPAFDYEFSISAECGPTDSSGGGISVIIKTPLPVPTGDAQPAA